MQQIWFDDLPPVVATDAAGVATLVTHVRVVGVDDQILQVTIRLVGELCPVTTPMVTREVSRLLALGAHDLRFELDELRLCTSVGIDLWVDLATHVLPQGGDVRLSGAHGVVRRALDAVGVDDSGRVCEPPLR